MNESTTVDFYRKALAILARAQVPYLVGGAWALGWYAGVARDTKDFDVFVRRPDCEAVLEAFAAAGVQTEMSHPHWLGKAICSDGLIDVIFSSGNGMASVDAAWFEHAVDAEIFGVRVRLCPAEELIWSKAFVMERERYDGADIAHLLRARGRDLDWPRLLERFGPYWRILLAHLILFGFIYPGERDQVPVEVMRELLRRLEREIAEAPSAERICQGTLISRAQYMVDVNHWGYLDARLRPRGSMTRAEAARWSDSPEATRPTEDKDPGRPESKRAADDSRRRRR